MGTRRLNLKNDADFKLWNDLVESSRTPDVYYRPGYSRAYEMAGQGRVGALLVESGTVRALLPLLFRELPETCLMAGEAFTDALTPYGYGGLMLAGDSEQPSLDQVVALLTELQKWCRENDVVSIYVRLHPLLRQERWLNIEGNPDFDLHRLTQTIGLDLSNWDEERHNVSTLSKGRRSDLKYARRLLRLSWASERSTHARDLRIFREIYEGRMTEIGASDFYHFSEEYYSALLEGLGDALDICIAWKGEEPVGAALFMTDRVNAHYHLSASSPLGRECKATTMILNAAAGMARSKGCRYLHLGGGATPGDTLAAFKESFGGDVFEYFTLGIVADRAQYNEFVRRSNEKQGHSSAAYFFPAYRA